MFEHSIKVPRLYKTASKLAKDVKTSNASVKKAVFENKHVNKKALYALIMETLQHEHQLDFLLRKSQLLEKENRLDEWLARVLISELLWGKKQLPGDSKPIQTILAYQQVFQAHLDQVHSDPKQILNKTVSKPRYVRVNTLALTVNEAVEGFRDEGWKLIRFTDINDYEGFLNKAANLAEDEFMVDIHVKELLLFPPNTQFYRHNAYKNGEILLQDKASCLPVQILDPQPGSVVLDMCAAPGMKTSQIAAMIKNEGTVYAVERDIKRVEILRKFVETSRATCVQTINKDVLTISEKECPNVDYILVDPSCSGSGITDRVELDRNNSSNDEKRMKSLQGFQIKILKHALRSFSNVKRVVYSTCSLNPLENEEVVKEVISSNQRFKLVPIQNLFTGGWFNFGSEEYGDIGKYCLYAKPDDDLTNGFFVAVFEKLEDGEENQFFNSQWSNFVTKSRQFRQKNVNDHEVGNNNYYEESIDKKDRWKRRDKKLAKNTENETVENEDINRKRKLSENDNDKSENVVNDKVHKKKKKKKSKNEDIDYNQNEELEVNHVEEMPRNIENVNDSKKKRKKEKRNECTDELPENGDIKKTKKKKVNDDNLNLSNVTENVEKIDKKHKKKKQKLLEAEESESMNKEINVENESLDAVKEKSKKSKKKSKGKVER